MKTGSVIGGIILLIIGAAGYVSLQSSASDCRSLLGQIGIFISSDISGRCGLVYVGQILFSIIFVIGIVVLIYGAVAKRRSVFICGYCKYVTQIESDLYEHYEKTHRETRHQEQERYEQMRSNTRSPTYYAILGIDRLATHDEITKQYRKLVLVWHPDQNRSKPDAAEYFKIINEAYEILRDKDKRREYDRSLGLL